MKRTIASLGLAACLTFVTGTASAAGAHWEFLEGAWRVDVQPVACVNGKPTGAPLTPAPFPTLNTYHLGGTLSEHGSGLSPSQRGSGHGIWKRTGYSTFAYRLTFQIFSPAGLAFTQDISSNLAIASNGETFKGTSTFTRTDTAGGASPLQCATLSGTRIKF